MAIIDVVKSDIEDGEFVSKFPSEDLRLGSQLVVRQSQKAFFVKGGIILDGFEPGTYTLQSGNIPLLNKAINIPFGGESPFQAEVWFVNLISKLDNKWGTATPIQIEDPEYHVVVPVRSFGQFGVRIGNPRLFLTSLVGTAQLFSADKIVQYFSGKILSVITTRISKKLIFERISVLQIGMHLEELSRFCESGIREELERFGIDLVNFYVASVNVPETDPSVVKLKEAKELAMKVKTVGKDIYQMDRSFDVMEKAAGNEGVAGSTLGAGMGFGMGVGIGSAMSGQMGNVAGNLNSGSSQVPPIITPPPLPTSLTYHVAISGAPKGPFGIEQLKQMISDGQLTRDSLVWNQGMNNWEAAQHREDLRSLFALTPPPLPR